MRQKRKITLQSTMNLKPVHQNGRQCGNY